MSASTIRQDIWNVPNLLTMFRIVLIPAVCVLILEGTPESGLWALGLFWVASVTDWLDGYIARRQGLVSVTGKFLDPLADKLLVMAAMVILVEMGRVPSWLVIALLSRELTITGLRAIASAEGFVIAAGEGGKIKTSFQMTGVIALLAHYTYEVDYLFTTVKVNFNVLGFWLLMISLVFSITSAVEYFRGFIRAIDEAGQEG